MSHWKIAAAQYEPPRATLAEHVAHHLQFVEIAASQQCELLVFPSLSLTDATIRRRHSLSRPMSPYYSRLLMRHPRTA